MIKDSDYVSWKLTYLRILIFTIQTQITALCFARDMIKEAVVSNLVQLT